MNVTTATQGNLALAIQDSTEEDSRLHTVETSIEFNAAYGDFEINIRVYADNEMGWRWLTDGLTAKTRDKAEIVAENMIAWHVTDIAPKEDPVPFLVIVEKPAPVCPSALREPKGIFMGYGSNKGRSFEAQEYGNERRVFQCLETGATYHLKVTVEQVESQVFTASFINGRIVDTQDYVINRQFAGRSMRFLENAGQAVAGAFDHMQSLVLCGKA
jgi:hypothetical protein